MKLMYPSWNRQIVLIDKNNSFDHYGTLEIQKFHHPVAVLSRGANNMVLRAACRGGHTINSNIFVAEQASWLLPFDIDTLKLERCA